MPAQQAQVPLPFVRWIAVLLAWEEQGLVQGVRRKASLCSPAPKAPGVLLQLSTSRVSERGRDIGQIDRLTCLPVVFKIETKAD